MSDKKRSRGGRPSRFPPEFRSDAVAMVLDESRSIADVARATGVNAGTLGNWVGLVELRAENAQLRMERDLLKRSLAFWVKETSTP